MSSATSGDSSSDCRRRWMCLLQGQQRSQKWAIPELVWYFIALDTSKSSNVREEVSVGVLSGTPAWYSSAEMASHTRLDSVLVFAAAPWLSTTGTARLLRRPKVLHVVRGRRHECNRTLELFNSHSLPSHGLSSSSSCPGGEFQCRTDPNPHCPRHSLGALNISCGIIL